MDNVTHTLFGATLARTPLARAGRGTFAALVVASNAPDVDIIAALSGGTRTYLAWHRGPTHGPLGVLGLGLASAVVVCPLKLSEKVPSTACESVTNWWAASLSLVTMADAAIVPVSPVVSSANEPTAVPVNAP